MALVTGAARGIGAAAVRALCAKGYRVVAVDGCAGDGPKRPAGVGYALATKGELEELAGDHPDAVVPYVADVRDPDALAEAAALAVARFGRLDAVVAAAAVIVGGRPLWETPVAHVHTLWEIDVLGVWNTAAACVPHLLDGPEPGGCRFVAVASAAGSHGLLRLSAYTMAKHAVVGLVRGLAADLVGTGVTAVAVSPGSTRTPMLSATADLYALDTMDAFASSQLLRRLIDPAEIAATIAFCCSPEGGVLNGSVVSADGGFTP
ncbi:mycofactocin-coupled SDR family oxidoreductase [Nonomuraea glycinis]|uniref:mycofactocin-coupled SDR family oxidoreductase n=1 Tax=Nonomuraea glycinis TaxID=2047744 RepID=UPI002E0DEF03|nr:mycofactocin-coupled SDR family oxidoreductase [Nonomuraea glycinis]